MDKKFISNSIKDTIKFANNISKNIKDKDIILLCGNLGTGKTVISKAICKYFGVEDDVISPTFNILKTYTTSNKLINTIYHFDLYRIKNTDELDILGFDDYIYRNNSITLIEWPELVKDSIISKYKLININYSKKDENERIIEYEIKE